MSTFILVILEFSLSFKLTGMLWRYALDRKIMDVPNERSSHLVATPRGGGIAIVLTFLGALPVLWLAEIISSSVLLALVGTGFWVSLVGFLDDRGHIAARWRLMAHCLGASWALAWLGGMPPLVVFGLLIEPNWFWHLVTIIYLIWMLNLYNFMDGIDGLASLEAITVCLGGIVLYWLTEPNSIAWVLPALLIAAVAGFLCWNFPPARIFMGDAGSGFLGITLGILPIIAARVQPELFWAWLVLLGVFVVDSTTTLLRRVLRGHKIHEAHRSHAYQYLSRLMKAHRPVSLGVSFINLVWLLPIAIIIGKGYLDGFLGMLFAYLPLIGMAFYFKAGASELQEVMER
ncbi:MraY family glycosyltransferase [Chitinimonas sp. BJB300]|uniref:MraY family glycosyltransferase n=1 Tax=Chitinimonas sp. BJB300 TaxID=1559339 RepID=UPI000C0DC720|nr:glycosyltransferase family 4 protein [Chitinimonas sp. BJB300]PHV11158.1 glycosyl transferase [Chitinimonas sp. BJB300]TSJ85558.1 glycosyltransferase family 4 protein [Chitinimonas sp. BJB300]